MFRYIAFVWNDEDPQARQAARELCARRSPGSSQWRPVLRGRGIEVRCTGERDGSSETYRLADGRGVVLGKLFAREADGKSVAAPLAIGEADSRAIASSGGRRLIEKYWGRYVAFVHEEGALASWVLRDPSAALPCYTLRRGPVDLYFSSMEDVLDLCERPPQIDWSYVLACLCLLREHCPRSGLREVSQLVGGECVHSCLGKSIHRHYWDPLAIGESGVIEDERRAAHELAGCVKDVVRAWGASYRAILLSLSGGLDSSIVLASLAGASCGSRVECYHYYPLGTDLNERRFARLAAARAGKALAERARPEGFSLEPLLRIHASAEPTNYPFYLEHSRTEAELAAENGADALFIGYGGDQLFYQERSQWIPGDFLHRRGLRPRLLRVLLDSARMDDISVWSVLGETLRGRFGRRRWSMIEEAGRARPLLSAAAVAEAARAAYCLHPLLRAPGETPSGKLWHAHQVVAPFDFYDPLGSADDPERIAPLLSQPLMELCLRLPTYVLTSGGWDRALARRAFYEELPPEIRNRRNKGGIEAHVRLTVQRNRSLVHELLWEGRLVREGLIERSRLERTLSGRAESETQSGELLEYAGIEAWLRRWAEQVSARKADVWQTVT